MLEAQPVGIPDWAYEKETRCLTGFFCLREIEYTERGGRRRERTNDPTERGNADFEAELILLHDNMIGVCSV